MNAPDFRPALLLVASVTTLSCATFGLGGGPDSETRARFSRALAALDGSDFESATRDLEWLAARCRSGRRGRTALLLLAATELDPRNPERSPDLARRHAATYLTSPRITAEELPVARSLYLLAVDLGGRAVGGDTLVARTAIEGTLAAPDEPSEYADGARRVSSPMAERFEDCGDSTPPEGPVFPTYAGTTTANRLATLHDSVAELDARASDQARQIQELQAELERVRKLLKGGGGGRIDGG